MRTGLRGPATNPPIIHFNGDGAIIVVLPGWDRQYERIAAEFGYSSQEDSRAAALLDGMLAGPPDTRRLQDIISGRTVVCAGAGASLLESLPHIGRSSASCIAADSALPPLLKYGILPDIVVTDLDGDDESLMAAAGRGSMIVVHAHGDNADRLHMARRLPGCIGTAQTPSTGHVQNYGGFTDGDRAAFLASRFGARRIILCGMDLGGPVTAWSNSTPEKPRKLRAAARLLEWMAGFTSSSLYTVSYPLRDFQVISPDQIVRLAGGQQSHKNNNRPPPPETVKLSAEQIRGIAALREKLHGRVIQLHEELEETNLNIAALDAALKRSSFTKASEYTPQDEGESEEPPAPQADIPHEAAAPPETAAPSHAAEPPAPQADIPHEAAAPPETAAPSHAAEPPAPAPQPITAAEEDTTIGSIRTYPDRIVVKMEEGVAIPTDTSPFRTFFLDRVLGEMEKKDAAEVDAGLLPAGSALSFEIDDPGGRIRGMTITNYRTDERAREIDSTVRWVLNRMLENAR